jgi:hypothetical protein
MCASCGLHIVLGVRNLADPKVVTLARESKAEIKLMAEAVQAADLVVWPSPGAQRKAR